MELAVCTIVSILVSFQPVTATPHGYGVKSGAAAQAVAGASAGAFSGAAGLPIALPHGTDFSGSYSKSSSSSFASSSASSSSNSFSFSGSGLSGTVGGCTSGNCQNGDVNGLRVPNGNVNGFSLNNGANGLAAAQAGAFAGSQSLNKDATVPLCSGDNCPNQNVAGCKGPNCSGVSSSDNKCESGLCGSTISSEPSTYNKEPKDKCTSGQCNTGGLSEVQGSFANSNNNLNSEGGSKCTSDNCRTTLPKYASSSNYNPSDECASGQCGPSSGAVKPTAYRGNNYPNSPNEKCSSGQCGSASEAGSVYSANGGNSYPNNPNKCTSGQCGPSLNAGTVPSAYDDNGKLNNPNNKCTSGQCGTSSEHGNSFPSYDLDNKNEKCISGQCNPLAKGVGPIAGTHNTYDIPINIASSSTLKPTNYPSHNFVNTPGSTTQSGPGCSFGNCVTLPSLNTNTYSRPNYSNQKPAHCDSPDCNNGVYNHHASAPGSASVPAYIKPVTYLTAPKHDPLCTSPNCQSPGISPGYYPSESITPINGANPSISSNTKNPICSNSNCGHTQPPNSNSVPVIPNQLNSEYKPSGTNTSYLSSNSPQSSSILHNVPSSGFSSYKPSSIQHGSSIYTTPSHSYSTISNPSPNGPNNNYPNNRPKPQSGVSNYKPTHPQGPASLPKFSYNQATTPSIGPGHNNPKTDDFIPPFVALSPPKSSNCGGSVCSDNSFKQPNYDHNSVFTYPTASSGHSLTPTVSNYPATHNTGFPNKGAQNPEKPYLGGFGAPSGLLKPNDFTLPSTATANGKPTATAEHHLVPCTTGNCNTQPNQPQQHGHSGKPLGGTYNSASCLTGNCGPQNGQTGAINLNGANSAATAVASAKADTVAYSGGFGGPPGLLKPFDDGKITAGASTGLNGKNPANGPGLSNGNFPTSGVHSTAANGGAIAGAQATAVAGASAGAFGGSPYGHSANGGHGNTGGCGGGCNGGGSYGYGRNLDVNAGHPKGGYHDDLYGGISGAGAAAKAISFGSSFASAHASAGAATKEGYGRR